jgi:translocator protein
LRWLWLLFWLALCFVVAGVGAKWSAAEIVGWYRSLRKPRFNPPDRIFGPVWTLLYFLMAMAAWRFGEESDSRLRAAGLILFLVQLGLNLAWSWIFFKQHSLGWALTELCFLWTTIGATTLVFSIAAPGAACLMAPYWAWVSFAALLNWAAWRLNR